MRLEEDGFARFPKPIVGRIPNFVGAEAAANKLIELTIFKEAERVKVNPDSPQRPVRHAVIRSGKILLTPTPRLRNGFLLLQPGSIPLSAIRKASTIGGAGQYGKSVSLFQMPDIDLVVLGSVAVSPDGARLGKGHGYGEIEFGILKELNLISERAKIVTTVHEAQIVNKIPIEEHDVPVDFIVTPKRVLETKTPYPRPPGIIWNKITSKMLEEMPVLKELKEKQA